MNDKQLRRLLNLIHQNLPLRHQFVLMVQEIGDELPPQVIGNIPRWQCREVAWQALKHTLRKTGPHPARFLQEGEVKDFQPDKPQRKFDL